MTVSLGPLLVAIAVLALGTFAFRYAGPALRRRGVPPHVQTVLATAATLLLFAVAVTSAVTEDQEFAGFARPLGVVVAGVLAWKKAPFVVVVLSAAVTAAALRLVGIA